MITLFTTSWTIKCPDEPNMITVNNFFEDLSQEFYEMLFERHSGYEEHEHIYVFTLTYPAYQAKEYADRIMEYCVMIQDEVLSQSRLN